MEKVIFTPEQARRISNSPPLERIFSLIKERAEDGYNFVDLWEEQPFSKELKYPGLAEKIQKYIEGPKVHTVSW